MRWVLDGGPNGGGTMTDLGVLDGGSASYALATSSDGSVLVGYSNITGGNNRAFRWVMTGNGPTGVMSNLGTLTLGTYSLANNVSANGLVVVGEADNAAGEERAFRWTAATGMKTVEDWLTSTGVTVGAGMESKAASDVSDDGNTVVGQLQNGHAFIAVGGAGLVTIADLHTSLASAAPVSAQALASAEMVMHGAHSRPLSYRVGKGKNTFWTAGDIGRDDHSDRDGDTSLAELGYGYNFGAAQLNVAVGRAWATKT